MKKFHEFFEAARELHKSAVVIDSHCDTTQKLLDPSWMFTERHDTGHVDLPRARDAGIDAICMAIWAMGPMDSGQGPPAARRQMEALNALASAHSNDVVLASTSNQVLAARADGRIAILPVVEGAYILEDSTEVLAEFAAYGVVYVTLTHGFHTSLADSSGIFEPLAPEHGGLSSRGKEFVREMNRLGVLIDVSHASDSTIEDVLARTAAPVIASHSSCRAVASSVRNLPDELIQAVAATGGVVQVNFSAGFIDPDYPAVDPVTLWQRLSSGGNLPDEIAGHATPLSVLANHFDHAISLVGYEHVGIGSDFDGVPHLPCGMEDCSQLVNLTAELLRRGHAERDIRPVLGENFLRQMRGWAGG